MDKFLTHVQLHYPYFVDQIEPKGRLIIDKACHAAWYYFGLANQAAAKVGKGIEDQIITIDDGDPDVTWMENRFDQIARSVATLYQLESPEQFLVFTPLVMEEAERLGYEIHPDAFKPFGIGRIQ